MSGRVDIELIGDDTMAGAGEGSDSWMISYLDVLTLIIAFFVLMLAMSEPIDEEEDSAQENMGQPGDTILPGNGVALLTGDGALLERDAVNNATESTAASETAPDAQDDSSGAPATTTDSGEAVTAQAPANPSGNAVQERMSEALASLQNQGVEVQAGNEGITIRLPEGLLFTSGSAELTADGLLLLDDLQSFLQLFEGQISVEGHTDSFPIRNSRFSSNWELSTSRAIAVVQFLAEGALPDDRLRAVGYASTQPLESNATAAGRAANRRVELILRDP